MTTSARCRRVAKEAASSSATCAACRTGRVPRAPVRNLGACTATASCPATVAAWWTASPTNPLAPRMAMRTGPLSSLTCAGWLFDVFAELHQVGVVLDELRGTILDEGLGHLIQSLEVQLDDGLGTVRGAAQTSHGGGDEIDVPGTDVAHGQGQVAHLPDLEVLVDGHVLGDHDEQVVQTRGVGEHVAVERRGHHRRLPVLLALHPRQVAAGQAIALAGVIEGLGAVEAVGARG